MKLVEISIRNFRRLEDVTFGIDEAETVFVGPNNSGKTSAALAFRSFLGGREFSVHDFSVARIQELEAFGETASEGRTPQIELDLWFKINLANVAYGRAFLLLPSLNASLDRLGLRLAFGIKDPGELLTEYRSSSSPPAKGDAPNRTLTRFLGSHGRLKRHFGLRYYTLAAQDSNLQPTELGREEGKKLLHSLVRIDFIDAQRMMDDSDTSRSNRLSDAFAEFYKRNLEQTEVRAEAGAVVDDNNKRLTEHYGRQFSPLMKTIRTLGVPSINDRELRLISSISPETALRGNTELLYVDETLKHELPELYNGLGFKNLIYMAVQVRDYQSQWIRTADDRPLIQLLFIEEPEVHLHAQVQQAFVANICRVLQEYSASVGEPTLVPQILITTHSSHILNSVDLAKVRYFRRCPIRGESRASNILNASEVKSLQCFPPHIDGGAGTGQDQNLDFLRRYLKLTHCDLFFADAAILVEGAAERLLIPAMIEKVAPNLRSSYLSILEVGGAFASRFESLLAFLRIPYLVITDLDSVECGGRHAACRADAQDAITSNPTLRDMLGVSTVEELLGPGLQKRMDHSQDRYVTFPAGVPVAEDGTTITMIPRTLEEAIVYQNFPMLRSGSMQIGIEVPAALEAAYEKIYLRIKSGSFRKTDFALTLMTGSQEWHPPHYITEGLNWLRERLTPCTTTGAESNDAC